MTVSEAAAEVDRYVMDMRDELLATGCGNGLACTYLSRLMLYVSHLAELVAACAPENKEAP